MTDPAPASGIHGFRWPTSAAHRLVYPGDDTALQVCHIGESCVVEECENLVGIVGSLNVVVRNVFGDSQSEPGREMKCLGGSTFGENELASSVQSRPIPVIETDHVYLPPVEAQLGSHLHCVGAGERVPGQSPVGFLRMTFEKVDDFPWDRLVDVKC